MQKIIILRGAPASGKSTIAKKYRSFQNRIVWLKVDNFKDFFDSFAVEVRPFVHGAANATLAYFLQEGFSVVMDGVFQNPEFIEQAVAIAKAKHIPCQVFELKVSLKTLQERDRTREGVPEGLRPPLGDEEIEKVYTIVCNSPYPSAIPLDAENLSIEECIRFINKQFTKIQA